MAFSVVLDTCALYPAYLRDTLLRLAAAETHRALWSDRILGELDENLAARIGRDRSSRIVGIMGDHFQDALVVGYEPLIDVMSNDPKDRHVLAAAVRADAAAIVTFNLADFPPSATDPYAIETLHPDEFLLNQIDLAPGAVLEVLRRQAGGYNQPSMDLNALAGALARAGCPQTAEELRLLIES